MTKTKGPAMKTKHPSRRGFFGGLLGSSSVLALMAGEVNASLLSAPNPQFSLQVTKPVQTAVNTINYKQ
jgi:hypothetical protein